MEISLPALSNLSQRVTRVLGSNPGKFTLQGTNTYLVGTGRERLLIDTGEGKPEYIESLKLALKAAKDICISGILITHWHHDHVDGIPSVQELCQERGNGPVPLHKRIAPNRDSANLTYNNIVDGQVFSVEGATLTAYHTPGHAEDHMVFYLKEESAMFSGDNVLGHGTSVCENLVDYMQSLRRMKTLNAVRIYPGHGDVVNRPVEVLDMYIKNLQFREARVVQLLQQLLNDPSRSENYVTVTDIAKEMYRGLPMDLLLLGKRMVQLHLEKLQSELRITPIVREDNSTAWTLPNQY
ncbi:Metallo-hydrolase/oxidoreductase [Basidiobolus meristosporus CBS 931.73]|uniref:Metallo-hydrolase/oxidoreductase n=1 Tax=Basidiobolus meristosporus CBS 931.73 TaxID=1314790 RepID=A0A1Y1YBB7_9FUNG|nr:Metallo-hydrolase/oxidoreductase [Basidiobolus meristosporus CBS 931.73]|eukprot:ORX95299.1 Metallo-hydrolase/oxidoreductase [Basidiobolus meristosporus CBS 931.73]